MRFSEKVSAPESRFKIGKAVAKEMTREGGRVAVIDLSEQHGNQTVQEIAADNGEAIFAKCSVGDVDQVKAAIQAAVGKWARVDVVVNDAARMTFGPSSI